MQIPHAFQLFWLLSSCRACPHFSYYGGSHFVKRVQISSKHFGFVCSSNLFTQFANLYIQAFRNTYENSLLWISEQINEFKVTRQSWYWSIVPPSSTLEAHVKYTCDEDIYTYTCNIHHHPTVEARPCPQTHLEPPRSKSPKHLYVSHTGPLRFV